MKKGPLFILVVLVVLISACSPIPVSGSWDFYYFWTNAVCPPTEVCINGINHTTCLFVGDRFTCGEASDCGGQVEFDGTTLTLRFDQGSTSTYWGTFQPDGTISGVWSSDDGMERIGTWWMEQR